MADMIIKPSSGNDLVIQGGDNSPAITVGTTGTTTFAENATLSGSANNLGTTTAGTLSSGVTFPVGHVLQTLSGIYRDESSTTSSDYSAPAGSNFEVTITPASTSNKIWVFTSWEIEHANADVIGTVDFYRAISGGATVQFIGGTSLTGQGIGQIRVNANSDRSVISYGFLDSPSTTSATTYRPSLRKEGGTGNLYIGSGGTGCNTITVQEIKG